MTVEENMCLTIPGKVLDIKKGIATVVNGSEKAQIDLSLVFDVKPGDWILYATNRAVKKISEDDAKEIISLLEEYYHPVDLSKLPLRFKKILFKVRSGQGELTKDEIIYLLKLKGKDNLETLYAEANFLRREKIKDFICIHGIIEFSNYCKNNCLYCGIRHDNNVLERYRMSKEEICEVASNAVAEGYKLLVLQSGEDFSYSDGELIDILRAIKFENKVFIFLSVGERSLEFYKKAYKAGASGALIRFESSDAKLFEEMRPGTSFEERLSLIKGLTQIGYYVATGSIFGLPGQTIENIASDLLTLKSLNVPMISSGPYIGAQGTPLQISKSEFLISNKIPNPNFQFQNLSNELLIELTLKYTAISRFLMPESKIPITTALETIGGEAGRRQGLLAGGNSLMFNLTPEKYSGDYKIYDNKYVDREKIWQKYGLFTDEESYEMLEEKLQIKL